MLEKSENWKKQKKLELKSRIERLAKKIPGISRDIKRWESCRGRAYEALARNERISLRQTRKKIYKLEAELKEL